MSNQSEWQDQGASTVSANSFRNLTAKLLKKSAPLSGVTPPSFSQHVVTPEPVQVQIDAAPQMPQQHIVQATPVPAIPAPAVAAPVTVTVTTVPVVAKAAPELRPAPVSKTNLFGLDAPPVTAPILTATLEDNDQDLNDSEMEVLSEHQSHPTIDQQAAPITEVEAQTAPLPLPEHASAQVLEQVADVAPMPVLLDAQALQKRMATFAELDLIALQVYGVPTPEDRATYLREAAALNQTTSELVPSQTSALRASEPVAPNPEEQHAADLRVFEQQFSAPLPPIQPMVIVSEPDMLPLPDFVADTSHEQPFLSDELAKNFVPEVFEPMPAPQPIAPESLPVVALPHSQDLSLAPPLHATVEKLEAPHQQLPQIADAEAGELARSLLDMMASSTNGGLPHERALAADTLLRLYPRLPMKPLIMLSERLSAMDAPPQLLVGKVIRDSRIEVAAPMLENGMQISDQDLVDVIGGADHARLRLIARRRRVSRVITDRLLAVKDSSVHITLVRNSGAEISHAGYLQLSDYARHEPDLLAPLATRTDLSAPFAFELFWLAPTQLRRYLLNRFLTDSETLNKILKITMAAQGLEPPVEAADNPVVAQALEAMQMALNGQMREASELLAGPVRVSAATIERLLGDPLGEPMTVMLRAVGFPRNDVLPLLKAVQASEVGLIDRARDLEELAALFDTLSFNKARILLTYWDWSTSRSGPYAPVH